MKFISASFFIFIVLMLGNAQAESETKYFGQTQKAGHCEINFYRQYGYIFWSSMGHMSNEQMGLKHCIELAKNNLQLGGKQLDYAVVKFWHRDLKMSQITIRK